MNLRPVLDIGDTYAAKATPNHKIVFVREQCAVPVEEDDLPAGLTLRVFWRYTIRLDGRRPHRDRYWRVEVDPVFTQRGLSQAYRLKVREFEKVWVLPESALPNFMMVMLNQEWAESE